MKIHNSAAAILQKLQDSNKNVKSLVYSSQEVDKKSLMKIVCESCKYAATIKEILKKAQVKTGLDEWMELVLTWEFLFGKRKIQNKALLQNKSRLKAELARLKVKRKVVKDEELLGSVSLEIPKYIRVNTLKTSQDKVLKHFLDKGFKITTAELKPKMIARDLHLENVFLLHSSTDLHDDEMYNNGSIIFQDKASCFSAFLLHPCQGSEVIDATAAPGNKTSHLAAIMGNTGKIYAFERDFKRFNILTKMLKKAGCDNTIAENMDFLKVDPFDAKYDKVKYILLDPSCSGSGIVGRLDLKLTLGKEVLDVERLETLSKFQKEIILHAFKFPQVQKVVYSTCSIYQKENEDVVQYILESQDAFKLEEDVFPEWKRRGVDSEHFKQGKDVLRTFPEEDKTIGFFVAVFKRITIS